MSSSTSHSSSASSSSSLTPSSSVSPGHVVLLGDSIFDNQVYVGSGPDVAAQLRSALPEGWQVTLLARDGAVVDGVARQLDQLPKDATLLVMSAGGNDALGSSSILEEPARSVGDAVSKLVDVKEKFAARYDSLLTRLGETGISTAVCTIYDANYPPPRHRLVVAGLTLFNDIITRAAFRRHMALIDLRLLCDSPHDYANPIEPSVIGGRKIAQAIATLATNMNQGKLQASQVGSIVVGTVQDKSK